jgi:hypothetical protein
MTVWARLTTCSAAWLLLLLLAGSARAEYRYRVVLLERHSADDSDHEIAMRIRAELGAAGFEVIALAAGDEGPKQAVEEAGYQVHPASVLLVERLTPSSDGGADAELWLSDRLLRKTVVLRLKGEPPASSTEQDAGSREAARIAVQAVELVKARLAELSLTRERATQTITPLPPPPAAPELRGARPNLTAALGLLEGFQDGQQSLTPVLRLGVALPERWTGDVLAIDVRGGFIGLGRAAHVEHGEGSATLRHTAVELDAVIRFLPKRRLQPFVSLGGGFLALDVNGTAPEPYRNSSQRTFSGLVTAGGGVWLQPVLGIGLVLEGHLLNAWSKTVVRISGTDAAEVAAPLLLLSAGLMVEF